MMRFLGHGALAHARKISFKYVEWGANLEWESPEFIIDTPSH
jgi:hypothetical protein